MQLGVDLDSQTQSLGVEPMHRLNMLKIHGFKPIEGETLWDSVETWEGWTKIYTMNPKQHQQDKIDILDKPVVFCVHGAGHTALSFTLLAKDLTDAGHTAMTYDLRGHSSGIANEANSPTNEMEIGQLVKDLRQVLSHCVSGRPVLLVGHSLGGSIVARLLHQLELESPADHALHIKGVVLIEASEGLAIRHFPDMVAFLDTRPKTFANLELAVQWAVEHNQVYNAQSARISVPPQLVEVLDTDGQNPMFCWKLDLLQQRKHWSGWFKGLCKTILQLKTPVLALTAGEGRLDKELLFAAQSKQIQVAVIRNTGHSIMEDDPKRVCDLVLEFWNKKISKQNLILKKVTNFNQ